MWDHLNVEKVFGVCDAGEDGGSDDTEKEVFGDGGSGETRGKHADWQVDGEQTNDWSARREPHKIQSKAVLSVNAC